MIQIGMQNVYSYSYVFDLCMIDSMTRKSEAE